MKCTSGQEKSKGEKKNSKHDYIWLYDLIIEDNIRDRLQNVKVHLH